MTHRKNMAPVMIYRDEPVNRLQLAAATGLSYYVISDRYLSGDRDEDLIRPLNAPRTRKKPPAPRRDFGPTRHTQKRKPNAARTEARRAAVERAKAEHAAVFCAPLIAASLLSSEERKQIRESILGRQRWWTVDSAYMGAR